MRSQFYPMWNNVHEPIRQHLYSINLQRYYKEITKKLTLFWLRVGNKNHKSVIFLLQYYDFIRSRKMDDVIVTSQDCQLELLFRYPGLPPLMTRIINVLYDHSSESTPTNRINMNSGRNFLLWMDKIYQICMYST